VFTKCYGDQTTGNKMNGNAISMGEMGNTTEKLQDKYRQEDLGEGENPCGGGVEYLHREPASRKRRRNGTKKGRAIA
jgi:hypothetical protein